MAALPRLFPDATIVCLASGPSLTAEDVAFCRGKAPVIAVNDTVRWAPWADVLYACDAKWWEHHQGVPAFTGLKLGLEHPARRFGVQILGNAGGEGLALNPAEVMTGLNSGYQAINVAVHLGAARIVLLGYDMQILPGQPSHFFGDHPRHLQKWPNVEQRIERFGTLVAPLRALGVSVINASRQTALTCFPRQSLAEALA